jgi:hypothetical protein
MRELEQEIIEFIETLFEETIGGQFDGKHC